MLELLEPILIAILSAIAIAVTGYLKSHIGEEYDKVKFLWTIIVGIVIGILMGVSGIPVTEASFEAQLLAYAGLIGLLENLFKWVLREIKNYQENHDG